MNLHLAWFMWAVMGLSFGLALIWNRDNALNVVIKFVFFALGVWALLLVIKTL